MKLLGVRSLLILSIFLTVVSAVITYLNVQQKKESTTLVIHTYKVIQASTRLLSLLKDMEIGHRGYLITADTTFLSPYHEALRDIDQDIDTLTSLVHENPRQLSLLQNDLMPLVERKRAHLEEGLTILKKFGRDSASHFAGMRIAKVRMDSITFLIRDFIQFEQEQLKDRSASLEQRYVINDVVRFTSFALIGITSLVALLTIISKENDNRRLLNELHQFNLQLEKKVEERTRELVEANRDLVSLNEEKNNFLGITTHDLKAPLAGIAGMLELMRLDKNLLTPKHLEYIQLMQETCDNMQGLITNLLDLSRIEQGKAFLNFQSVSIPKIFSQLEDHFRTWAFKKNIQLVFRNGQGPESIYSDPDALIRILDNLISNALKFSPAGKSITVSVAPESSNVRFEVQDHGPGIKAEERSKLFRRFQRLSARPTDGESSSGLGLSIVKDLVDMLNGTVEVVSEQGNGALFIVRLPLQSKASS